MTSSSASIDVAAAATAVTATAGVPAAASTHVATALPRFDAASLASSLVSARELEERVGHIGWYIGNKRARIQEQYRDSMHGGAQMAALVHEHTAAASSAANIVAPAQAQAHEPASPIDRARIPASPSQSSRPIFAGVCIWINGLTNPGSDTLRSLVYSHGGRMENILVPGVTHWVAMHLPTTKLKEVLAQPRHKPVVTPEWITESVRRGVRLLESEFTIPQLRGRAQQHLSFGKAAAPQSAHPPAHVHSPRTPQRPALASAHSTPQATVTAAPPHTSVAIRSESDPAPSPPRAPSSAALPPAPPPPAAAASVDCASPRRAEHALSIVPTTPFAPQSATAAAAPAASSSSASAAVPSPFAAPAVAVRRAQSARRNLARAAAAAAAAPTRLSFAALSTPVPVPVSAPLSASTSATAAPAAVLQPPKSAFSLAPAPALTGIPAAPQPPALPRTETSSPVPARPPTLPIHASRALAPRPAAAFPSPPPPPPTPLPSRPLPTTPETQAPVAPAAAQPTDLLPSKPREASSAEPAVADSLVSAAPSDKSAQQESAQWLDDEEDDDVDAMVAALDAAEQVAQATRVVAAPVSSPPPHKSPAAVALRDAPISASVAPAPSAAAAASDAAAPPNNASTAASSRASLLAAAAAVGFHVSGRSTLTDPDFVPTFFQQSRLHFLGSWSKHFETLLPALQLIPPRFDNAKALASSSSGAGAAFFSSSAAAAAAAASSSVAPAAVGATPGQRVVMHVDMDCFFVSVAIRNEAHLADRPVVVCHSKGTAALGSGGPGGGGGGGGGGNGSSSISSASYAARKLGIGAETTLGRALQLCPELIVRPYDFDGFISVSEEVYRVFFSFTHQVQSVSCDEAFLEFPPGADGRALAEEIRAEVFRRTGCPCSAGVGPNMLLARLATKQAKPAGSFAIASRDAGLALLRDLPLKSLQGVGRVLHAKLEELNLRTCGDVLSSPHVTRTWLQQQLGSKTGDMVWASSHGTDHRALVVDRTLKKSIGADVNYGLRFLDGGAVQAFIAQVAAEVIKRLRVYRLRGYVVTVKAKKRREGYPVEPPHKFLGHGVCDSFSKSLPVKTALHGGGACVPLLARQAWEMYQAFRIVPTDLRGFGISIGGLEFASASEEKGAPPTATAATAASSDTISADAAKQHEQSSAIIVASRQSASAHLRTGNKATASPHKLQSMFASNALTAASFAPPPPPPPPPLPPATVQPAGDEPTVQHAPAIVGLASTSSSAPNPSPVPDAHVSNSSYASPVRRPLHLFRPVTPLRPPPVCLSPVHDVDADTAQPLALPAGTVVLPTSAAALAEPAQAPSAGSMSVEPPAAQVPGVAPASAAYEVAAISEETGPGVAFPPPPATSAPADTVAAAAAPFVFTDVVKPGRDLSSELALFPHFSALDKGVIAELPVEVRKELAVIYKAKRARDAAFVAASAPASAFAPRAAVQMPERTLPLAVAPSIVPAPAVASDPAGLLPSPAPRHLYAVTEAASAAAVDLTDDVIIHSAPAVAVPLPSAVRPPPQDAAAASSARASSAQSSHSHSDELDWSQLDRSVLAELPPAIRSELKAEARRRKQAQLVTLAPSTAHAGKKRKGAAAGAGGGAGSASTSGAGGADRPVKVLNIAAHFQQIAKKQKRASALAPVFKPLVPVPIERSRPQASSAAAAAALPSVGGAIYAREDDEVVSFIPPSNSATSAAPAAAASAAAPVAVVASSSSAAMYTRGFTRVDPKSNPHRYAAAATATATAAAAASPEAPNPVLMADDADAAPPSHVAAVAAAVAPEDDGVVPMELDLDESVKIEAPDPNADPGSETVAASAAAPPVAFQPPEVARAELPPLPRPPLQRDRPPMTTSDVAVRQPPAAAETAVVPSAAAVPGVPEEASFEPGSSYESFEDVRPWLHMWLLGVASPPRHSHVRLLERFCTEQLLSQRNLACVSDLLAHVQRVARGDWLLLTAHERKAGLTWRQAFDHLLECVQPLVMDLFGGRLPLQPFAGDRDCS